MYNLTMRELGFLNIINNTLSDNSLLGDDCAFLRDLNIFVTQDTLVQDVHFSLYTTTPYLLGRKSVSVNLSDIAASLAVPEYVFISLSLPSSIKDSFVSEFYRGVNEICNEYNIKVAGGDITSAEKVIISVCAVGKKSSQYISSRSFAKKDWYILAAGSYGASSAGLYALSDFLYCEDFLINSHLNPRPCLKESEILRNVINSNIAVMDTSDGLVDALYKIAAASKHSVSIDFNKVPVHQSVIDFSLRNNLDYKKFVLWGGEDYGLIIVVPEDVFMKLDTQIFVPIGKVINKDFSPVVNIFYPDRKEIITKEIFEKNTFNHFKEI